MPGTYDILHAFPHAHYVLEDMYSNEDSSQLKELLELIKECPTGRRAAISAQKARKRDAG